MSKQIKVKINGIEYLPVDSTSDSSKPPDEPGVNYRALVNDKLEELGTFYEGSLEKEKNELGEDCLYLSLSYGNEDYFIKAERIQEVLKEYAHYAGDESYPIYMNLFPQKNWEEVYRLLLDNEHFIKTGERS